MAYQQNSRPSTEADHERHKAEMEEERKQDAYEASEVEREYYRSDDDD